MTSSVHFMVRCSRRPLHGPIVRANRNACLGGHGLQRLYRGDKRLESHGTVVAMAITDDTLPSGPRQVTRNLKAPFARASREDDYRVAWAFLNKTSPEK